MGVTWIFVNAKNTFTKKLNLKLILIIKVKGYGQEPHLTLSLFKNILKGHVQGVTEQPKKIPETFIFNVFIVRVFFTAVEFLQKRW